MRKWRVILVNRLNKQPGPGMTPGPGCLLEQWLSHANKVKLAGKCFYKPACSRLLISCSSASGNVAASLSMADNLFRSLSQVNI